ncbi:MULTISPECIES: LacI family DNA-binding transcriptional regulator [unclassified Curtobacterium]|uniref:LacI family DNA-binding transcriptional regulator n=1 Tax=unclassified Curtobacterium TaxID=257496 RepID=UPI0021AC85BB|nr:MULTISPECIES: LacI family DNA-binding transcriptional regulator [unclassified Curtobacterium]
MPEGPPRLRDVAERAGVSIRTVSNVVNGYARVSEAKRVRVEEAVAELGYRPNVLARNLRNGRSGLIALIVPEIDVPYFAELARAVVSHAQTLGLTVVVDQTDGQPDRERELIQGDGNAVLFDGVIFSPLALSRGDLPAPDRGRALVLLGERIADSGYDHVAIDNVAAARAATEHLFAIGRRRIAAIGDQPYDTGETAQLRTRGYESAHEARGVPVDRSLVVPTANFHFSDGARAMTELLEHPDGPPDAVFCYNDLVAMGAMRVLLSQGRRVPEDVALVGFDDIEAAAYQTPSLTTVRPDRETIARLAVERLVAILDGTAEGEPGDHYAGHELVVRESTVGRTS